MNADGWTAFATIVAAFAALVATWYAKESAAATRLTSAAQLFSSLMTEYATPAMGDALAALRSHGYAIQQGGNAALLAEVFSTTPSGKSAVDDARRMVAHFFWKATAIVQADLLSDGLKREILALSGKDLMFAIVIPMERVLAERIGNTDEAERLIAQFSATFTRSPPMVRLPDDVTARTVS